MGFLLNICLTLAVHSLFSVMSNGRGTVLERIQHGYVPEKSNYAEYIAYQYLQEESVAIDTVGSEICTFLDKKSILLTGGTGFLGKLLVEKLLRSCQTIQTIYLIVRSKKGVDFEDRVKNVLKDELFSNLEKICPRFREKIVAVKGDIAMPFLGLNKEDIIMIREKINIIYHGAATTRFNEHIRKSVKINIGGTEEILKIAQSCKKLQSFVHISTAYSNCNRKIIEEKIYEPLMPVEKIYKIIEENSDETLQKMTSKLIDEMPNTYSFTKQIAEHLIGSMAGKLPICIVRPSMVTGTYKEPLKGWIDNFFGPMGAIAGVGLGLIHTNNMNMSFKADLVPADYVVNECIVASYKNSLEKGQVKVYNFVSGERNSISWGSMVSSMMEVGNIMSSPKIVWTPFLLATTNFLLFRFLFIVLHIIPGFLVDLVLRISGKKPMMLDAYDKIYTYIMATKFFSTKEWKFHDSNTKELYEFLSEKDKEQFNFDIENMDWSEYYVIACFGTRIYLLKDPLNTLEEGWKKRDKRNKINRIIFSVFVAFIFCVVTRVLL